MKETTVGYMVIHGRFNHTPTWWSERDQTLYIGKIATVFSTLRRAKRAAGQSSAYWKAHADKIGLPYETENYSFQRVVAA